MKNIMIHTTKNLVAGIVMLLQYSSSEGMENIEKASNNNNYQLMTSDFFGSGISSNMNENFLNVIRAVASDEKALAEAVNNLSSKFHNCFGETRKKINQEFLDSAQTQQKKHKYTTNKLVKGKDVILSKKKAEVQTLRKNRDALIAATHERTTDFFDVEKKLAEIDMNLQVERKKALTVRVSDLFSEEDFANKASVFERQLKNVPETISKRGVEGAFFETQAVYNASMAMLSMEVERKHKEEMATLISQFNEKKKNITERYDEHIAFLNGIIQRLKEENARLETKYNLITEINMIVSRNPLLAERSLIRINAAHIMALTNFAEKKKTIEDLYSRFILFSNLYGRHDLGVEALPEDLVKIRHWIQAARNIYSLYEQCKFPSNLEKLSCREDVNLQNPPKEMTVERVGSWRDKRTYVDKKGTVSFSGSAIAAPLNAIKNRISNELKSLKGSHAVAAKQRLNNIFQNNAAINVERKMVWTTMEFWDHATDDIALYNNGNRTEHLFQE